MKRQILAILCVICAALMALLACVPVFAATAESDDIAFVRSAFQAVSQGSDSATEMLGLDARSPVLRPRLIVEDLVLTENPSGGVDYSCTIPGATTVVFNLLYNGDFGKETKKYCARVPVSGTLFLETNYDGSRYLSGADIFSLYRELAYPAYSFDDYNSPGIYANDDDFRAAFAEIADYVMSAYGQFTNTPAYFSTVESEFSACLEHAQRVVKAGRSRAQTDAAKLLWKAGKYKDAITTWEKGHTLRSILLLAGGIAVLIGVPYLIYCISKAVGGVGKKAKAKRKEKRRADAYTKALSQGITGQDSADSLSGYSDLRRMILDYAHPDTEETEAISAVVRININKEKPETDETTLAGWGLAALGRCALKGQSTNILVPGKENFRQAIDKYNETLREYQSLAHSLQESGPLMMRFQVSEFERLKDAVSGGLIPLLENDPGAIFHFLIHILCDTSAHRHDFLRQGCIMGLLDFLESNKTKSKEAANYYDTVCRKRDELTASANNMSFFEVRVPSGFTANEYAAVLRLVLRAANPNVNYCDLEQFMALAVKHIPGVMDLLSSEFPLRIIDPGNDKLQGFYEFSPYSHVLVTAYTGAKDIGAVTERYNNVNDMTVPNAVGLNLRLFTDIYSAIPTLFHEHHHYRCDRNEASVFLKTQVFSMKFYKKYKDANPSRDPVFATLMQLLGKTPSPDKVDKLNAIIKRCYGEEQTEEQASLAAVMRIKAMNEWISRMNRENSWCKNIQFPSLGPDGDNVSANLIQRIIVRHGTTKKSLAKSEFSARLRQWKADPNASPYRSILDEMQTEEALAQLQFMK